jgi:hypothetical protein
VGASAAGGTGADQERWTRYGWLFALAYAVCAALRLARFNANIDAVEQPHKSAGFLTGVPAPAGAGLVLLPIYLWSWTGEPIFRETWLAAPWAAAVGFLMISNLATFSWGSLRLRSHVRLGALVVIALVFAALISAPFPTLSVAAMLYAAMIPFSIVSYAKVKRQRARAAPTGAAARAGGVAAPSSPRKGEQDFAPVQPHRHVDRHQRGEQGEGEEERGSQVSHSLIPLLIHSRRTPDRGTLIHYRFETPSCS